MHINTVNAQEKPFLPVLLGGVLLLLIGFLVFGPSGQDDPYITYAAVRNLVDHHILANINGDAVEQGSSVLHVLLLGLAYAITNNISTLPLPELGIVFSLFFALLCLPMTYRLATQARIYNPAIPVLLLALSTAFTYWAMGGLESTLTSCIVLYCVFTLRDFTENPVSLASCRALFFALTLFLLARPEAFFVLLATVVLMVIFSYRSSYGSPDNTSTSIKTALPKAIGIIIVGIAIFSAIAALRLHFFGQLFPQPVYAKAGHFALEKLLRGLIYFPASAQLSLIIYSLFMIVPVLHWLKNKPLPNNTLIIAISFTLAYLAFIVTSGGDWMGGGRFFVPVLPLMACIFSYYLQSLQRYRLYLGAFFMLLLLELATFSELQATGMPIYKMQAFKHALHPAPQWEAYSWAETSNYIHANDIALLAALKPVIKAATDRHHSVTISGVQMGMVPFFLRAEFNERVNFVDMRGLTTRHITDCSDFADATKLWTGVFVDYPHYFAAQANGHCNLPVIDIIYELQNLNEHDNAARLQALQQQGYHIVYRQNTLIKGGYLGKKVLNIPYIVAVSQAVYQRLPDRLRYVAISFSNDSPLTGKKP